MTRIQRVLLRRCETALVDWGRSYAPEQCGDRGVAETTERIDMEGGTLAYIGDLLRDIRKELKR